MDSSDLSTRLTPHRLQPASATREVVNGSSGKDAETKNRHRRPAAEPEESSEVEPGDEHQIDSLA